MSSRQDGNNEESNKDREQRRYVIAPISAMLDEDDDKWQIDPNESSDDGGASARARRGYPGRAAPPARDLPRPTFGRARRPSFTKLGFGEPHQKCVFCYEPYPINNNLSLFSDPNSCWRATPPAARAAYPSPLQYESSPDATHASTVANALFPRCPPSETSASPAFRASPETYATHVPYATSASRASPATYASAVTNALFPRCAPSETSASPAFRTPPETYATYVPYASSASRESPATYASTVANASYLCQSPSETYASPAYRASFTTCTSTAANATSPLRAPNMTNASSVYRASPETYTAPNANASHAPRPSRGTYADVVKPESPVTRRPENSPANPLYMYPTFVDCMSYNNLYVMTPHGVEPANQPFAGTSAQSDYNWEYASTSSNDCYLQSNYVYPFAAQASDSTRIRNERVETDAVYNNVRYVTNVAGEPQLWSAQPGHGRSSHGSPSPQPNVQSQNDIWSLPAADNMRTEPNQVSDLSSTSTGSNPPTGTTDDWPSPPPPQMWPTAPFGQNAAAICASRALERYANGHSSNEGLSEQVASSSVSSAPSTSRTSDVPTCSARPNLPGSSRQVMKSETSADQPIPSTSGEQRRWRKMPTPTHVDSDSSIDSSTDDADLSRQMRGNLAQRGGNVNVQQDIEEYWQNRVVNPPEGMPVVVAEFFERCKMFRSSFISQEILNMLMRRVDTDESSDDDTSPTFSTSHSTFYEMFSRTTVEYSSTLTSEEEEEANEEVIRDEDVQEDDEEEESEDSVDEEHYNSQDCSLF